MVRCCCNTLRFFPWAWNNEGWNCTGWMAGTSTLCKSSSAFFKAKSWVDRADTEGGWCCWEGGAEGAPSFCPMVRGCFNLDPLLLAQGPLSCVVGDGCVWSDCSLAADDTTEEARELVGAPTCNRRAAERALELDPTLPDCDVGLYVPSKVGKALCCSFDLFRGLTRTSWTSAGAS
jgi:hypothetical protein